MIKKIAMLLTLVLVTSCTKGSDITTDNKNAEIQSTLQMTILNNFAYKTFGLILKDNNFNNTVYSSLSFGEALGSLTKLTDDFKENEYIKDFYGYKSPKNLSNLVSKNLILSNKELLDLGKNPPKELKHVSFPKEAQKESYKLQKKILGEVLLEPNYTNNLSSVILNVANFKGQWEKPFDKKFTEKNFKFNTGNQKENVDLMTENDMDEKLGFEDEFAVATRKKLKQKGTASSFCYIIVPKKIDNNLYEHISNNINTYIEGVSESGFYDTVILKIPKLKISNYLDLLQPLSKKDNTIKEFFQLKKDVLISKNNEPSKVDKIIQVASLSMDEVEVQASAITEIEKNTAQLPSEKSILEVVADKPYFVVITSQDENHNEIITFLSFIRNPSNK
ncbi:MAG: serpin family protein [Lagierella massiliensis]|nr:serpin family protein [Lagierella massiliensis]